MSNINLFSTPITKLNYNLDWDKIKPEAEKLVNFNKQHHLEENGWTSYENTDIKTHTLPGLSDYYSFLFPYLEDFIFYKLNYPKCYNVVIQNAWFSKYLNDGYVRQHSHSSSVVVACLYIELPENGGNIEFKNPFYSHRKDYIQDSDKWLWEEVQVKESDVLLFDGAAWHRSQPNQSNKERWTLTSNFGLEKKKNDLI